MHAVWWSSQVDYKGLFRQEPGPCFPLNLTIAAPIESPTDLVVRLKENKTVVVAVPDGMGTRCVNLAQSQPQKMKEKEIL
jgi:hypothetical protein